MQFDTRIDGRHIKCVLTPSKSLTSPVFCFSCMAPMTSTDGFERLSSVGGYTEIQLPDIAAGEAFEFLLSYENPEFAPANRAWLPMGTYLRTTDGIVELASQHPTGVQRGHIDYGDGMKPELILCPQPSSSDLTGTSIKCLGLDTSNADVLRADRLSQRAGLGGIIAPDGIPLICRHDPALRTEAYTLDISDAQIVLSRSDEAGAFYGGVSLATLMFTHDGHLPCGKIHDAPRFEWRGQHLDCARHFYQVDTILRLLDLMALMKLNRFHWHFADDEAFRLELDSLPELAQTHYRGEGQLVPGVFGGGAKAGGSYSRADAKRIIAHAKALNIEVMPEIEVPAHAFAIGKVFPVTRDLKDSGTEQSVQGYHQNVLNPALPETWRIWQAMVDELAEIFPFSLIHLGGDELPENTWHGSPAAMQLMRDEGLKSTQDLQGWTMNRLGKYVQTKGKQPGGWEESALGSPSIGGNAVIFSWTGQGPGLQAARDGHPVVMMPGQKTYLDMAQSGSPNDWGAKWAAVIGLEETINWDPVPDNEPELEQNILGIEGAFWSEFTTQDAEMEPMLAPRILGIAMMGWQSKGSASTDELLGLRAEYARLFEQIGWAQS